MLTSDTGEAKTLSLFECKLLNLLASNRNKVVTRAEIEEVLWQGEAANEQSLNNFIAHLRKYLQGNKGISLHTIKSVGYKLVW
ncbi:winged helix-turn-helix domain-containing protein [Phocaeicola salanitronis]|uniref:winged helix-turn-helix domain-containing protein n=1 Tax=Phocaeicola salanitronis TaxID=376805 RepID=UPI0023F9AA56|nr:winged helix-turn-helix domain-containing protein [Phocaeicola salanitronis]